MAVTGPLSEGFGGPNSKDFEMLMMELPAIVGKYLSRLKFPLSTIQLRNIERKSDEDGSDKKVRFTNR
jgi:hypothetical protein